MTSRSIKILGVPIDLGGNHRGVDMGPSAIRVAGLLGELRLLGHDVTDLGNVEVPIPESRHPGESSSRFLAEITEACTKVADVVAGIYRDGDGLVVLGGDHSAAIGSVSGLARHFAARDRRIGVIWVDAHTDMNTPETSPSGNIHGMPAASIIGHGPPELTSIGIPAPQVNPENMVFIGIRSVDIRERELVRESGVHVYTMRDLDQRGIKAVMEEAIGIACEGTAGFHLSFDVDAVDDRVAPGVGTPVPGGLTYREAHLLTELAADSGRMIGMDIMEVNPVEDVRNQTAILGVELISSAYGKMIL